MSEEESRQTEVEEKITQIEGNAHIQAIVMIEQQHTCTPLAGKCCFDNCCDYKVNQCLGGTICCLPISVCYLSACIFCTLTCSCCGAACNDERPGDNSCNAIWKLYWILNMWCIPCWIPKKEFDDFNKKKYYWHVEETPYYYKNREQNLEMVE